MKVYIGVDMEGVAGISHPAPTRHGEEGFAAAAALMTGETNAAIEGAFRGGATAVLVNDGHGRMLNLSPDALDSRATLLQGQKVWSAMEGGGPDRGHDVALFIGYHARAGAPRATISHTYSENVVSSRLNNRAVGETGLHAAVLGDWGVPVALVAGDDVVVEEARGWLPWAEGVVVKQAFGRHAAASIHPSVAREKIMSVSERAVRRASAGEMAVLKLEGPILLELEYRHPGQADYAAFVPGVARVGDLGVRIEADNMINAYRSFLCGIRLASLVT
ncbi:MAG: M55 family metallopeptidase [bacterium]